jgi:hypothetical protein
MCLVLCQGSVAARSLGVSLEWSGSSREGSLDFDFGRLSGRLGSRTPSSPPSGKGMKGAPNQYGR